MTSIATVEPKLDSARIAAGQSTTFSFAVNNTTGRSLRMGARMLAEAPAEADWCKLSGKGERELGPDDFDQFDVDVKIPANTAPGEYRFRLLVFQTDEPGESFTESPTVSIEIPAPDVAPEPEPPDGKFPWWIAVVIGVVVLLLVGGVLAWLLSKPEVVPDVTDMQLDEAIIALQDAGLEVPATGGIAEEWTGEADPGFVIRQAPEPGSERPDDLRVTLTIEQLTVAVPSIIGMKVPAARKVVLEAGLKLSDAIDYRRSDRFPGGAIIAQRPASDQRLIPGQEVSVTVAEELIRVPTLQGKSYGEASIALEALGLGVGEITYEKTGGSPDSVVRQKPAANTEAKPASRVHLWLVEKKIPVPGVKGKAIDDAQAAIVKAGLEPVLLPIDPPDESRRDSESLGKVQEQRPSANSKVYTGTEVTLVYYRTRPVYYQIAEPMWLAPQLMEGLQNQQIRLREVQGQVRAVAPESE